MNAKEIASMYHTTCAEYDEVVCSERTVYGNLPVPASSYEVRLVSINAQNVLEDAVAEAAKHNITREEVLKAIHDWLR